MRTYHAIQKTTNLQDDLYYKLNDFSQRNKTLGRLCSVPVSLLDVALDTIKSLLAIIENVGLAAINLVGAAFYKEYTLKDALICTEGAFGGIVYIPVKQLFAPVKVIFQIFAIIINPEKVHSINYMKPTFRS